MKRKVARPRKKSQRSAREAADRHAVVHEAVAKLLLEASLLLWEDAEQDRCSLGNAAAWAVRELREQFLSGDVTALHRMAGYKRSAQLQTLMSECDAMISGAATDGRSGEGLELAISHAILALPRVLPTEIPRTETLQPIGAEEREHVERSLSDVATDIANELRVHAQSPRHIDGQSVVRKALTTWGVSSARAIDLLKFLADKRPRKTGGRRKHHDPSPDEQFAVERTELESFFTSDRNILK